MGYGYEVCFGVAIGVVTEVAVGLLSDWWGVSYD